MPQYLIRTFSSPRENLFTCDFMIFHHILHLLQKTCSLQAGISSCANFSTERLYCQQRCDQSPSDRLSLVARCCNRSLSSSRCTLNDTVCCQLRMRGWAFVIPRLVFLRSRTQWHLFQVQRASVGCGFYNLGEGIVASSRVAYALLLGKDPGVGYRPSGGCTLQEQRFHEGR